MSTKIFYLVLISFIIFIAYGMTSENLKCQSFQISDSCEIVTPKMWDRYENWFIKANCNFEHFRLFIYNRHKNLVFKKNSFENDGFNFKQNEIKIDGNPIKGSLPDGNYVWVIEVKPSNEDSIVLQGQVKIGQFTE